MEQTNIVIPDIKDLPEICNFYGQIRVKMLRQFLSYSPEVGGEEITDIYREWRDTSEHIVLSYLKEWQEDLYTSNTFFDVRYMCVKAAKRGNDVYRALVKHKWRKVEEVDPVQIFQGDWGEKHTPMLSITLSYNQGRGPVEAAWETFGEDFHLWLAKLRQEYGDFEYVRCWEATNSFYPHAHVLIAFKKTVFNVFEHTNKDGSQSWLIGDSAEKKIAGFWHSFSNIRGCQDTGTTLQHLVKYITKDIFTKKGDKTNAMLWLHGNQAYAISKGFFELLKACFAEPTEGEPKTCDLISPIMQNCNKTFEFVGIFPSKMLKIPSDEWFFKLNGPPPEAVQAFWREQNKELF